MARELSLQDLAEVQCASCSVPLTLALRCAGCQAIAYCSPACQRIHWKACHKTQCKELSAAKAAATHILVATSSASPTDLYNLGLMYSEGRGVRRDFAEFERLMKLAAEAGHPAAQYNHGLMHASPSVRDFSKALHWWWAGAAAGDAGCMRLVGKCYATGSGVDMDGVEAVRWFKRAAEAGDARAMFELGMLYLQGKSGVAEDRTQALHWLQTAAGRGDKDAAKELASMPACST